MIIAGTMVKCDICGSEKFLKPDCNDGWNNLILQSFTGPVMEKTDKPPMVLCYKCSDAIRRKIADLKWE